MLLHANAKLGLAGRLALVRAVDEGLSLKAAAAAFSVSPATAHRWWHRWLEGDRQPGALLDRSSRPRRSPRLLAAELQERICDCRRQTGWGPRLVAGGDRLRSLDRLEGAQASRTLAPPATRQEAGQQLRVAVSGRPAAHGREPLRALPAARTRGHR